MSTPTQRTLKWLRSKNLLVSVVEQFVRFGKFGVRRDLFHFADILAISANATIAVQTTSTANHSARRTKILEIPEALAWLQCPSREIWIVSWTKGKRGEPRVEQIVREMFSGAVD